VKKYILDSSIIIKYPKLLNLKLEDAVLIVTQQVLDELGQHASKISLSESITYLIDRALMDRTIQLINPIDGDFAVHNPQLIRSNLSKTDYSLLTAARYYLSQGDEVKIATIDTEVIRYGENLGIEILHHDEIQLMLQLETISLGSRALQAEIISYEKDQKKRVINQTLWGASLSAFIASLVSILGNDFAKKIDHTVISTIAIWGPCLVFLILGILLYYWRERRRLSYGVFELLVGFFGIIMVFSGNGFELSKIFTNTETDLKLVAGLYIMVRGQDNIVKSLKDTKAGIFLLEKFKVGG